MSNTTSKPITIGIRPSGYKRLESIATTHGMKLCDAIEACAIAFLSGSAKEQADAISKQIKQRPPRKRRTAIPA